MLGAKDFTGLDNYRRLLSDDLARTALVNTFQYVAMEVLPTAALSLLVAVLVNSKVKGRGFFQSVFYLPVVTSISVLALIWVNMLGPQPTSPVNYFLGLVGIPPQKWFLSPTLAMPTVAGMAIWGGFGYYMLLWLAGLQSIPSEVYEAARIDGAGQWQQFWGVTLPLLSNTTAFILIIATIGALQVFGSIYIITGGGPVHATTTVVWYVWQNAFTLQRMGYAATVAVGLFLIILAITLVQQRFLGFGREIY
jgi:multiple sugar transport system permease protein